MFCELAGQDSRDGLHMLCLACTSDAVLCLTTFARQVNYWPSAKTDDSGARGREADQFFNASHEHISGERTKADISVDQNGGKWDDFKQAGDRWRAMGPVR